MGLDALRDNNVSEEEYTFPIKPVPHKLEEQILELFKTPTKIVDRIVERNVRYCKPFFGDEFELSESSDDHPKRMYSPGGSARNIHFCQMCKKAFDARYIEINKVEYRTDEYYWDELKLSLCLEHSKDFKALRSSHMDYEHFIEAIINGDTETDTDGKTVLVKIGNKQIAFTERHFAEVKQILRIMKKGE
jgi:hypothetical protein